jgi:hypothetical protein
MPMNTQNYFLFVISGILLEMDLAYLVYLADESTSRLFLHSLPLPVH